MSLCSGWPFAERGAALLAIVLPVIASQAHAADFDGLFAGTDDWGNVGLLTTPTARMRADGEFGFGISAAKPYDQAHIFLQPLPWLETVVRYAQLTDVPYNVGQVNPDNLGQAGASAAGSESYKDKMFDFKITLLNEARYWPELAVGFQDFGGVGLFSSEYLISNYHWYDLDFSFGLAWGRLGSGGSIHNPLSIFSPKHFDVDRYDTNSPNHVAGGLGLGRLFTGATIGPFGGVEWNTPVKDLAVRVEYDGNNYQHEPFGYNLRQSSRLNEGLAYRGLHDVDIGIGFERGNTFMARIAIYTNFQTLARVAKTADPQPLALPSNPPPDAAGSSIEHPAAPADTANPAADAPGPAAAPAAPSALNTPMVPLPPLGTADPAAAALAAAPGAASTPAPAPSLPEPAASGEQRQQFVIELKTALKQQGFNLIAVDYDDFLKEVRVWLGNDRYRNPAEAVGRTARVLSATAPEEVSGFTLIYVDQGVENYRARVERKDFEQAVRKNNPHAALDSIVLEQPGKGFAGAEYIDNTWLPKLSWDTGPGIRQSVGAPGAFYAGQLYWGLGGAVALTNHINLTSAAVFNIVNNFDKLQVQQDSDLPHVRSDIVQYLQQGSDGLTNLEADYTWSPYPDWYHRVSLGIFEWMYGGVASELLYRPYGSSWAVAFDINRVKQRGFDERFDFLPYTVTTGHIELYYKPGYYNLLIKLIAGQYLAGDHGATIDVSRQFDSGIRIGVFATKTDVSPAQFGEGEFDKGFYVVIPLDLFFSQSTRREAAFLFRPLTRDGGQMVYDGPELYTTVQDGQPDDFAKGASEIFK